MNLEKVLPPGVNGKVSGHLTVKVDEVFWTRNSPGEVFVELLWWGEKETTIFRPEDVTKKEKEFGTESTVTYTIKTSPGLFETYLRNCSKLTFTVLRGINKNVIVGSAVVDNIHQIISEPSYHSYFPIFNPKGMRIGDLHVCFELRFVRKQSHYAPKSKYDNVVKHSKNCGRNLSPKPSTATSHEDPLVDILKKGNELRKAMVMSVLTDCPVDKLDLVINEHNTKPVSKKNNAFPNDVKLVDFLLGKDMTPDEEKKAVETLRCVSPDEDLLKLAKSTDNSKVTKSNCCIHGENCSDGKGSKVHIPAPVSTAPTQPSSSSTDLKFKETAEDKSGNNQSTSEKRFNCYRLIVKTLNLTYDGSRKIYYAPVLSEADEPTNSAHHPPGTSFILEITLPSKGPWPRKLKFTTKDYKNKRVNFGQGTSHRLCGTVTWARVRTHVVGSVFTVYWRHLNQRVPCPLGSVKLDNLNIPHESDSVSLCLPIYSNTRLLTGHLNIIVSLGKIKRGGGEALFQLKENVPPEESSNTDMPQSSSDTHDLDGISSEYDNQPSVKRPSSKESIIYVSDTSEDEMNPNACAKGLDDELLRTINLLNSKADGGPDKLPGSKVPPRNVPREAILRDDSRRDATSKDYARDVPSREYLREVISQNLPMTTETRGLPMEFPSRDHEALSKDLIKEVSSRDRLMETNKREQPKGECISESHDRKRNACVQTTLPLSDSTCPKCSHDVHPNTARRTEEVDLPPAVNEKPQKDLKNGLFEYDRHRKNTTELMYQQLPVSSSYRSYPVYNDFCHPHENYYHCKNQRERLRVVPREYTGTEKIHEYCIKIEKVVGVPLFTGDKDMDCFVDYSFPKVNDNGIMSFDLTKLSTEIRIALRETEFGTISRHRLRLGCKLTRAFLTLPSHEITFYLWGRVYKPSPQDYRLGKAVVSLAKLSSFEMKYEQQRQLNPISEMLILPIIPIESSLTSGYRGPFGELYISIGYSNASGLSYREWRCKNKDDHYWCHSYTCSKANDPNNIAPNYECTRSQPNIEVHNENCNIGHYYDTNHTVNKNHVINESNNTAVGGNSDETSIPGRSNDCNKNVASVGSEFLYNTDNFHWQGSGERITPSNLLGKFTEANRQSNLRDYGTESKVFTGVTNVDIQRDELVNNFFRDINQRMQPIGESIDHMSSYQYKRNEETCNLVGSEGDQLESGKRENIVKKVLKEIQERKEREKLLLQSDGKAISRNENISCSNEDVFNSFNLRVDLPTKENDSSDFECQSQYSFLKTPVVEPSFAVNRYMDLESGSSTLAKQRLFDDNPINPFSSMSNISLNSNCSLFNPAADHNKLSLNNFPDKENVPVNNHLDKNVSSSSVKSRDVSKVTSRKNCVTNKFLRQNLNPSEESEKDCSSSNETLNSVESLKSYREVLPPPVDRDTASVTEFDKNSNNKLHINEVPNEKNCFKARVEISRALGLPSLEVKQADGKITPVKPTAQAYFTAIIGGKEAVLKTRTIENKTNPIWDSSWEVELPVDLLKKSDRELEIFVDLSADTDVLPERISGGSMNWPITLRTGIDLTPITAGLDHTSGWYSLTDRALLSRAQLKVVVTPLENVSMYRDEWLKEYTKSKGKQLELPLTTKDSSVATSLQEKLHELEKLTECMKNKMSSRPHWDESPPFSLLSAVQKQRLGASLEDLISPPAARPTEERVSVLVHAPPVASGPVVPVCSYDMINTYTLSGENSGQDNVSQNEDSLETPSQTINRILTRVRKNR